MGKSLEDLTDEEITLARTEASHGIYNFDEKMDDSIDAYMSAKTHDDLISAMNDITGVFYDMIDTNITHKTIGVYARVYKAVQEAKYARYTEPPQTDTKHFPSL